jgi:hypothetical protein
MSTTGAARLLAAGAAWRLTGAGPAGRALVDGLVTCDEAERAVAGISLTKAGDRSVPLLAAALGETKRPEPVVDVLASIGTPAARSALRQAADADSPAAGAAARALRTLDDIDDL